MFLRDFALRRKVSINFSIFILIAFIVTTQSGFLFLISPQARQHKKATITGYEKL